MVAVGIAASITKVPDNKKCDSFAELRSAEIPVQSAVPAGTDAFATDYYSASIYGWLSLRAGKTEWLPGGFLRSFPRDKEKSPVGCGAVFLQTG